MIGTMLVLAAAALTQAPSTPHAPASAPAEKNAATPALFTPLQRPEDASGAYLEVLHKPAGWYKTQRCGKDDQLVLAMDGPAFTMRWTASPQARRYEAPVLSNGVLRVTERRRSVQIERVAPQILRITFVRRGGKQKSYTYGQADYVATLPMVAVDDEGCEF